MPTPNLGYDKTGETDLDTFNQWFRAQPAYMAKLQSWGIDPNNVHLNDAQKQEMVRLAQSLGAVVDEGGSGQEVDDSGNFRNKSHKLRTALIVGGIAGAALLTAGAAGAFAGAAAPEAGVGLAGVEGGAAGLSDAALAGLGTGAMGATGVGAGAAGAAGAFDAAGNFIGDSTISSVGSAGASGLGTGLSTLGKVGSLLGQAGAGVGAAATAAGNNALDQEKLALQANQQNTYGQSAFETELMNRAKEEDTQRTKAGKDVYRASYVANPRVSPFDPAGAPKFSDQYRQSVNDLSGQGAGVLSKAGQYATGNLPALAPYVPINPKNVQGDTNTQPGPLTSVGNWLAPGLTIAQKIAQYYAKK